jgi:hypothetical protein
MTGSSAMGTSTAMAMMMLRLSSGVSKHDYRAVRVRGAIGNLSGWRRVSLREKYYSFTARRGREGRMFFISLYLSVSSARPCRVGGARPVRFHVGARGWEGGKWVFYPASANDRLILSFDRSRRGCGEGVPKPKILLQGLPPCHLIISRLTIV